MERERERERHEGEGKEQKVQVSCRVLRSRAIFYLKADQEKNMQEILSMLFRMETRPDLYNLRKRLKISRGGKLG